MTHEERFLSEGASYFGNRLIYKNRDMGVISSSGLVLNADGEATVAQLEQIIDVEVKPAKRTKAVAASAPEPAVVPVSTDIDDLLA